VIRVGQASLGLATALLAAGLATAQSGDTVYTGPGGWHVVVEGSRCALISTQSADETRFVVSGFREGEAFVELTLPQKVWDIRQEGPFAMRMGQTSETVEFNSQRNQLSLLGFPPYLSEAFRRSDEIELVAGGQVIAEIPLTGSAAAYLQFEACRTTLPTAPLIDAQPPPPPRPVIPGPNLSGPLPANRRATPIMSQNWISGLDFPVQEHPDEGRVQYMVSVGIDGRVSNCSIVSPSGSALLDEATCNVVSRRARFDPATDQNSNPIEGSYTGSVNWQIAD
jgi:TonB family protein